MKKLFSILFVCIAIGNAFAQCPQLLDQSQTTFDTGDQGTDQWQSFIPAVSGKLTQVNFYLNGIQTVTVTLEVRSGTGTGGALLYTNNYSYTSTNNEQVMSIPFGSAPTLTAGTTYTIRFTSGTNFYTLRTSGDTYASGIHYSLYGTVGDAWFKTFITPVNTPTISVSAQANPSCYGFTDGSITTSVAGGNGGNTFLWTPSGGTAQNASGLGANTYTVTVTDGMGCTAQTSATLINPIQVTMADPPDQTICAGNTTTAVNFSGAASYTWVNDQTSIGLAATGSGNIAPFTAVNAGSTPVVATITVTPYGAGCAGVPQTFTITVNPTPTSSDPPDQTLCNGALSSAITYTGPVVGTFFGWTNSNSSIGLASSGSGNISSFTATNAGTTVQTANITVIPTANGCTGPSQVTVITVNPIPTVTDPADQVVCAGTAVSTVNFTGTVAGTTYNWTNTTPSIGLAASGTGTINSFTAVNAGSSPVIATVTVTPVFATCMGPSQVFTITVNPEPTAVNPGNQTLCDGALTSAINFSGTVSGTTYTWTNTTPAIGLAASGSGNIASFTATNAGTTPSVASLAVTPAANGCSGPVQNFTITVNPTPTVNAISNQVVCAGATTSAIIMSGPVSGTVFNWTNSNTATGLAATGTGNIAAFTALNPGGTTITSSVTVIPTANGCSGISQVFSIDVNPLPVVTFSPVGPFCDNNAAYTLVEGSPAGGIYSGTGVSTGAFDPAIAASGIHTLTYTYSDVNGCVNTANQNCTVYASPVVSFSAVSSFCEDAPAYTLTEGTPAGGIYSGMGISGSVFDPAGAGPGSHTISYSFTDGNGCTNAANQTLTVNALPAMSFAPLSSVCVSQTPFALSGATPAGGTYSGPSISAGIFDPAVAGIGTHTITYTYTDGVTFCTNQVQQTLTVYSSPAIVANTTAATLCVGASVTLSGSGGLTYSWDNGVTDGMAFVPATGSITYTVTGSDVNGCQNTDQVTVTVYDLPVVNAGADQTICEGSMVTLNGSGATSYTWDNGATNGVAFTPTATTTYTVTGTDGNSCQNTDQVIITVDPMPVLSVSPDQFFCAGTAVTLNATGATSYNWNSGASLTADYTLSPSASTTVQVTGTSGVCTVLETIVLTLDDPALVSAGNDALVCVGFITYLQASGGISYTWNGPGVVNVTDSSYGFMVDTTAYYYLTAVTANGCTYQDSVLITGNMGPACTIEPFTSFSPNGDAVNETWKIQGIESFPENNVTILDRWGDVVFDQPNYDNQTVLWTGTLESGSEAPAGTYYFIVEITDGPSTTGWIQLLK
ncbi:MAG: gliding motility-associated C-terminal domain-containing protein [Bacteroidetes bacterium]|nr:gliding motility-associated C-terminal domain-containing protein [Bacteroidota bacterium]